MNQNKKISVILPVYNRKHLIMRAINSLAAQTCKDWELLIMDDGSSDGLAEMLFPLLDANPHWRYCRHSHRGLALTRNLGIATASGEYLTFLDSDDEYKPEHLAVRLDYMHSHPDVDFIHGGVVLNGPPESHYVPDAVHKGKMIHLSECYIGSTLFGKTETFRRSGGFKPLPYSAESEFLPRIAAQFRVEKVAFPTYIYYTGLPDSICTIKGQNEGITTR
ncbi:MAG TPA: glycosyltransferase family A protein [bacterium]|nr:glycosyltransferase family A protein [bacterium]